ncbi:MAG: Hsp70 family protein, partial [Acidobacteriota bacterium]
EVERMQKDASSHAEEDKRRLAEVEARNRLDALVYSVEKLLRENREKLGADDIKQTESALEDARKALNEGGIDRLNAAAENLTAASHRMAEVMYQKTGTPPPTGEPGAGEEAGAAGGQAEGEKKEGEVIDAEYVDVDEGKKPN